MRRRLLVGIAVILLGGLAGLGYVRSGRPRVVARQEGTVVAGPVGRPGMVAWIEAGAKGERVMVYRRWRRPRALLSASGLMGVAIDGAKAFVTQREGEGKGSLVAVDIPGGARRAVADVRGEARQVAAGEGLVAWLERRPAMIAGVPFLTAAGPVTLIRAAAQEAVLQEAVLQESGGASVVSVISAGEDPVAADLLGVVGGRVYWSECVGPLAGPTTHVRRGAPGGKAETVASEAGRQAALLLPEAVVWTADSQEADVSRQFRSLKERALEGEGTKVIADWLSPETAPLGWGKARYGQGSEYLWRLGGGRGDQRVVYARVPPHQTARVIGDEEYLVLRERGAAVVAKRPLSLWARVRMLVGG